MTAKDEVAIVPEQVAGIDERYAQELRSYSKFSVAFLSRQSHSLPEHLCRPEYYLRRQLLPVLLSLSPRLPLPTFDKPHGASVGLLTRFLHRPILLLPFRPEE